MMSRLGNTDEGFRVVGNVFTASELAPTIAMLRDILPGRSRGGVRGVLTIPAVRQLASDHRLVRLANEFIGGNPIPFRATLFDKSPRANWLVAWHQDTVLPLRRRIESAEWGPWTIKAGTTHAGAPASALEQIVAIRVHLDDSTSANGPLRVLPSTHASGLLSHEEIEERAARIPAIECVASTGGVVAMRPLVVHASSKSRDAAARRVLHIEYTSHTDLGGGVELCIER